MNNNIKLTTTNKITLLKMALGLAITNFQDYENDPEEEIKKQYLRLFELLKNV